MCKKENLYINIKLIYLHKLKSKLFQTGLIISIFIFLYKQKVFFFSKPNLTPYYFFQILILVSLLAEGMINIM
jgi:hypothetical protein